MLQMHPFELSLDCCFFPAGYFVHLVWRLGSCRPFNADVDLQLQAQLPLPKNTDAAIQHKDALMELPPGFQGVQLKMEQVKLDTRRTLSVVE